LKVVLYTVLEGENHVVAHTSVSSNLSAPIPQRAYLAAPNLDVVLSMNAPVPYDLLLRTANGGGASAEVGRNLRYVWASSFGPIVIEIVGNDIYVNGSHVEHGHPNEEPANSLKV
jgi:hypothetical protein